MMTPDQNNPTPPPLPPEAEFAVPIPPPMPVSALPYSSPTYSGRPGILSAVAVMSIIIACIGMGGSLMSGCTTFWLYSMSKASRMAATSSTTIVSPSTPAPAAGTQYNYHVSSGVLSSSPSMPVPAIGVQGVPDTLPVLVTGPNGLGPEDRDVAMTVLGELQTINEKRKEQLESFLAEHGQSVFPTAGQRLTAAQVKSGISNSQTVAPSTDDGGAVSFVTVWGTLNVDDDQAAFYRANSPPPLITKAHDDSTTAVMPTGPFGYGALTTAQVQQVIAVANKTSTLKLNASQTATLTKQLSDPGQQFLAPGNAKSPFTSIMPQGNGSVTFQFTGGAFMMIDPNGLVTSSFSPATFATTTMAKGFGITGAPCVLLGLEALLSLALAVLLLIAGIMVMRQSPIAGRLHRIYAWVKLPVAILFGIAGSWLAFEFGSAIASAVPSGGGNAIASGYVTVAVVTAIAACFYPIALLIVLRTRAVREYYSTVQYN